MTFKSIFLRAVWRDMLLAEALVILLSPHADRRAGDISFTVCLSVRFSAIFSVTDISGMG